MLCFFIRRFPHSAFRPLFAGAVKCKCLPFSSFIIWCSVLLLLVESFADFVSHDLLFDERADDIFFMEICFGAIWRGLRIIRFLIFSLLF